MLKLHGRLRSNYFNAVKAVLLEKGIEFEEVIEPVPPRAEFLAKSPMAKIPCLVTEDGPLTETNVILDYLEEVYPQVPLLPADPFKKAKARELCKSLELYIEWVARRGYGALRDEEVSDAVKDDLKVGLVKATKAVANLTRFKPWITGTEFTYADIFGYFMLMYPIVSAKANAEMDLLKGIPGAADWYAEVADRPSMQKVLGQMKEGS